MNSIYLKQHHHQQQQQQQQEKKIRIENLIDFICL
jgi:hypothetical protein